MIRVCAVGMLVCLAAQGQGMATRNATPVPKAKFSGLPFNATFTDVAQTSGLTARAVLGDPTKKKYIVEANGMGVAFLDYDNDGLLDVFTVNATSFAHQRSAKLAPSNTLYRNIGGGKFKDVTREAGMWRTGWGNGVCRGDFDNDGNEDLYVTYWGENALFHNKGDAFEEIAQRAGVAGPKQEWSTGCTFIDYDRDGHLDLFVASYAGFDEKTTPLPGAQPFCMFKGAPVFCGPRGLPHGTLTLYRNKHDGTFEDVSKKSGVRSATPCYAFTTVAADLNGDGWADLYVACDSTPSLLFRNNGDGTFRELATETGIAYSEHGAEQAGMGIAVADYNNDGLLDITKTNFIRDYPNLYKGIGKGLFEDNVIQAGLGVNPQYVLWGVGLEDFDNDGWRDVFQVGGHVYPEIEKIDANEPYANPRLLYRNLRNGKFEDVSHLAGPGIAAKHSSHGAAFGDFDNDGDIDVLSMNKDEAPSLLRNDLKGGNRWIKVALKGTTSNRSAIGAIVTVHAGGATQSVPMLSQTSYLSANDARLHFGLGAAEKADRIVVQWPSGKSETFPETKAGHLVLLEEGTGTAKELALKR